LCTANAGSLMSTSSLNQLRCGSGFQPATIQNPRAVGQWMLGFNLPSFDGQTERDTTHAQVSRCFGETQPTFGFALLFAITGDTVVAAQRDHPFPRFPIPVSSPLRVSAPAIVSSEQIRVRTLTASTISFAVCARL